MGLIEDEILEVNKLCLNRIPGSKIITSTTGLVRVEISKSVVKTVVVSIRFPEEYPKTPILIQLNSKHLGDKFHEYLTQLSEEQTKKYIGKPQIMQVLEFIHQFIIEHPLCACSEEISVIKSNILTKWPLDVMKLNQKASRISISLKEGSFSHKVYINIPENYPSNQVTLETRHSDVSNLFQRFLNGQSTEIARRCVEPPLNKKQQPRLSPFSPKPSLLPVVSFLVEEFHKSITKKCSKCDKACFPEVPKEVINNEEDDMHIERIYCGHFYHLKCLLDYMKTPPFAGGKKCISCEKIIYHEKYKVSPELSESTWAHQQAKDRELEEITDFLS